MAAFRRSVSWLLLAGFLATQTAAWFEAQHVLALDDAACEGMVAGDHQKGGPLIENDLASPDVEHCLICHLQRAMGHAQFGVIPVAFSAPVAPAEPADQASPLPSGVPHGVSPRGPPSLS
jgi:hypothetical protein